MEKKRERGEREREGWPEKGGESDKDTCVWSRDTDYTIYIKVIL